MLYYEGCIIGVVAGGTSAAAKLRRLNSNAALLYSKLKFTCV